MKGTICHIQRLLMFKPFCSFSWTVAIKGTNCCKRRSTDGNVFMKNVNMLLEEAKTLASVQKYHENIINLQGIVVNTQKGDISEVLYRLNVICLLYTSPSPRDS